MKDKDKDRMALRQALKGAANITCIDSLEPGEAQILMDGFSAALAREKAALDSAIDNSLRMVPFVLRGAFKKVLFP
ncbi:MAG: hypothetical protein ACRETM_00030 [Stenotrophobium sp.]